MARVGRRGFSRRELAILEPECGSFLEAICRAAVAADAENYEILRPVVRLLIEKYPADPRRLAMERHDRGADRPGDLELIKSLP